MYHETDPFYLSKEWRRLRDKILRRDHFECAECRKRGRYTKAVIVHHVKHRDRFPELELSETFTDDNGVERLNLISVCRDCHETVCHPERLRHTSAPITAERWD